MPTPLDLANNAAPAPKRKRRRRKPTNCKREGCESRRTTRGYCTVMCKAIDTEMARIQRIQHTMGPSPLLAEWWAEVVTLGDAWSRRLDITKRLAALAEELGITEEQWQAMKDVPRSTS